MAISSKVVPADFRGKENKRSYVRFETIKMTKYDAYHVTSRDK